MTKEQNIKIKIDEIKAILKLGIDNTDDPGKMFCLVSSITYRISAIEAEITGLGFFKPQNTTPFKIHWEGK